MKITKTAIAILLATSFGQIDTNAQSTTTILGDVHKSGNKGHFLFGTNLPTYNIGSFISKDYTSGSIKDTFKNSFNNFGFSLNVYAGYFISDKVCIGVNFSSSTNNFYSDYLYFYTNIGSFYPYSTYNSFLPSYLFFRYYFINDSTGINLFVEGDLGAAYSNGNYTSGNTPSTLETVPAALFSFNSNINLAVAYSISKHFSIPLKAGITYNYSEIDVPAYIQKNTGSSPISVPATENNLSAFSFVATLGLEYKI